MKLTEHIITEVTSNSDNSSVKNIGVSTKKSDKMIAIFTQHLYSRPVDSICRELASNMQDASRAAGTLNIPNIVTIDEDDGGKYISFRDFGTGMTPELINEIYLNILESTKEDNNDDIGMWGLGSKTPLSYREDYYVITTVPENELVRGEIVTKMVTYTYLIYKETTGKICSDLFNVDDESEEKQGTEVKVYFKEETSYYYDSEECKFATSCLKELSFFDNIALNFKLDYRTRSKGEDYNRGKIIDGEHFKYRTTSQYSNELHLVIDKVAYQTNWKELGIESIPIPVGIKFKIGELMVTPSREDIQYTANIQNLVKGSKELIRERIEFVTSELISLYNKNNQPVESLFDFIKERKRFEEERTQIIKFEIPIDNNLPELYTLNVSHLKENLNQIVFKPIQHLPIKLKANILPYFFLYSHTSIRDNRETKNENALSGLYNSSDNKTLALYKNKDIHSKEFRQYIKNCIFVKIRKIDNRVEYANWKHLLGLTDIVQNKQVGNTVEENARLPYLNDKFRFSGSKVGIGNIFLEYRRIIIEELKKELNRFIDYDTFEIPQEWKDEQKLLAKENYHEKVKVKGIISRKDIINDCQEDLELSTLDNYTGFIVYGFMKDNAKLLKIKALLECFNSLRKYKERDYYGKDRTVTVNGKLIKFNPFKTSIEDSLQSNKVKIFRIAVNNEKLFLKVPNVIHVDKFMESNNRLISKILVGFEVEDKYKKLFNDRNSMDIIKKLNKFVYKELKTLEEYYYLFNNRTISNFRNRYNDVYLELLENKENLLKHGIIVDDLGIRPTINYLDEYFKGCELLFSVDFNEDNIKLLADFLKMKGKKVHYTFYDNKSIPQVRVPKENPFVYTGIFSFMNDIGIRPSYEIKEYNEDVAVIDPNTKNFIILNKEEEEEFQGMATQVLLESIVQEEHKSFIELPTF